MSEAKEGEGVKEDFSECPEKEGAEKPGDSEMEAVGLVESPTAKDSPPGAEPELEAAAVACCRNGVSGGDTGIDGDASPTSQSDNYGELKERANEEHVSVFKECSNEQVNAETAEDVARLDEKLNEQGDNEKGDDAGEFSELMGKQVNAESENDAGEFNDNASAQAETNSGEDADELKEILGGEAILGDEEDTLSEQGKTENMVHDGEAIEDVKENAKIKTEEVIVKNMDIGDEKVVQTKEDCHVNLPLAEYKISTEHPGKVNGTAKSLPFDFNSLDGDDAGTEEEQAAFMNELENFFKERSLDFKPPKFYGEGLNCLKLWRGVIRLGGYDQVTLCKLWRQVGESFKPPKTCTTVSWSFRIFYEKALLDYERHKVQTGELQVAAPPLSDPAGVENQVGGNQVIGSGRARRESAARAMQGWHSQGLVGSGEEKSSATLPKREKQLKTLSVPKRKKPSSEEQAVKVARTDVNVSRDGQASSPVLKTEITIADVGPVAEWVKINVRRNKDCFEVYALVPGLLREEVRVQSDPAGRLVISGEPEQPDNPWGVTPFKKVINLPARINPQQTSAVVTLHGQLFVRAPFE